MGQQKRTNLDKRNSNWLSQMKLNGNIVTVQMNEPACPYSTGLCVSYSVVLVCNTLTFYSQSFECEF